MKLNVKSKTVTSYSVKLSEKEAQALLSDIVDVIGYAVANSREFRNGGEVAAQFPALVALKTRLHGL